MNKVAIIFAGGTGKRMSMASKPKQFLELYDKPIIAYTLEHFQNHSEIDSIILVCLNSWVNHCANIIKKYQFSKVKSIVSGGSTGQKSIYNGLKEAKKLFSEDSIVLIHDGVRPMIDESIITRNIECVKKYKTAITVAASIETIITTQSKDRVDKILNRDQCYVAKAPQCFILKDILNAHDRALQNGIDNFIDSASMMQYYGYDLHIVEGSQENIKITTPRDFYLFRALLDAKENFEIFG